MKKSEILRSKTLKIQMRYNRDGISPDKSRSLFDSLKLAVVGVSAHTGSTQLNYGAFHTSVSIITPFLSFRILK